MACLLNRPRDVDEMNSFCLALNISFLFMTPIVCQERGTLLHSFPVFSEKQLLDQCLMLKYHQSVSFLQALPCIPTDCLKVYHKRGANQYVRL